MLLAIVGFRVIFNGKIFDLQGLLFPVEGLGHNLFSVGQFYDSDLEVAFKRNTCFVRTLEGVDLLKGNRSTNLYTIKLHDMASSSPNLPHARHLLPSHRLWHHVYPTINFDTINYLAKKPILSTGLPKFEISQRTPLSLHLKTAPSYHRPIEQQNNHNELINGKKPDISFLHVFGALCYPKNDREDIGKLGAKGDIGFFIGYSADSVLNSLKPGLQSHDFWTNQFRTRSYLCSVTISTQNLTERELDLLFEAMYDEYIGGQPSRSNNCSVCSKHLQVSSELHDNYNNTTQHQHNKFNPSQATNCPNFTQDVDEPRNTKTMSSINPQTIA
ncbi:hypothetical protein Tco_0613052 [Tanacetum coccineum]